MITKNIIMGQLIKQEPNRIWNALPGMSVFSDGKFGRCLHGTRN